MNEYYSVFGSMTGMQEDTGITDLEMTGVPGRCPAPVVSDNDVRYTDGTVLPSVEEHQNSCPGKNKHELITNITCIATPGDPDVYTTPVVTTTTTPQDDKPTMEMGDDVVGCKEDLLTNPTADRGEGGRPRPRLTVGGCVYVVGGNCVEHGPGAKRYWHPTTRTDVGPDGIVTRTRRREYYYECNLGQRGRGRFRQARL